MAGADKARKNLLICVNAPQLPPFLLWATQALGVGCRACSPGKQFQSLLLHLLPFSLHLWTQRYIHSSHRSLEIHVKVCKFPSGASWGIWLPGSYFSATYHPGNGVQENQSKAKAQLSIRYSTRKEVIHLPLSRAGINLLNACYWEGSCWVLGRKEDQGVKWWHKLCP